MGRPSNNPGFPSISLIAYIPKIIANGPRIIVPKTIPQIMDISMDTRAEWFNRGVDQSRRFHRGFCPLLGPPEPGRTGQSRAEHVGHVPGEIHDPRPAKALLANPGDDVEVDGLLGGGHGRPRESGDDEHCLDDATGSVHMACPEKVGLGGALTFGRGNSAW